MSDFPRLLVLHGNDEFAMAERVKALKGQLDPSSADFNITELDGGQVTLTAVRQAADAMPFLGTVRLVVAQGWLTGQLGRGKSASDENEALLAYLAQLPDWACLVLVEPQALDERSKLTKAINAMPGGQVVRCDVQVGADLVRWIQQRAKALGGDFHPKAALALAEAVGNEPRSLNNEIEKLLAYVNYARVVEAADVEKLTPAATQAQIWDLVDALGDRNGPKAMRALHALLTQPGQDAPMIFAMVVRQFRLLLMAKTVVEAGGNANQISQQLKVHEFVGRKLYGQVKYHSLARLEQIYRLLLEVDVQMKTSDLEAELALDLLVGRLTRR